VLRANLSRMQMSAHANNGPLEIVWTSSRLARCISASF
jgi:hypothetical protein